MLTTFFFYFFNELILTNLNKSNAQLPNYDT